MDIRVKILAAVDPTMGRAFDPLVDAQKRALAALEAGDRQYFNRRRSRQRSEASAAEPRGAGSPYRQSGRQYEEDARAHDKSEKEKTAQLKREENIRRSIRDNTFRQMQRDSERAERQDAQYRSRRAERVWGYGRSAVGEVSRMARGAIGFAGDIARGAGIDPSLGSLTGKAISLEQTAIRATTSGLMAPQGDKPGRTATAQDVEATLKAIRGAGDETATSYDRMGLALEKFVTKSANLKMGKDLLSDMGRLANAAGVDVVDLADAAGGLAANMSKDMNADDLMMMMRMLAKQGAMGAVEMKDMAAYLPKIASAASQIKGDYAQNVGMLGAIAQESMKGGRASPAEAIRAAQAFVGDLQKPATQKYLAAEGIDVWADKGKTKLQSPEDVIKAVYAKTGGDQARIASIFRNIQSASALRGFSQTFLEAGGGKAGLDAISARFRQYTATMSPEEVRQNAMLYEQSKGGRAQTAQNRLETAWAQALDQLVPAAERLAPRIGDLADKFAGLVVWLADNPGKAIVGAIVGSIVKAALGDAVASGVKSLLSRGGGAGAAPGGPGGGGMGVGGAAVSIVAGSVAITGAGMALIDEAFEREAQAAEGVRGARGRAAEARANYAVTGDAGELERSLAELNERMASADEDTLLARQFGGISGALNWATAGAVGTSWDRQAMNVANARDRGNIEADRDLTERHLNYARQNAEYAKLGTGSDYIDMQSGQGGTIGFINAGIQPAAAPKSEAAQLGSKMDAIASALKGTLNVNVMNPTGITPGMPVGPRVGPDAIGPGIYPGL